MLKTLRAKGLSSTALKEIALALDLNVKQVDNHLYRAKRKLREVLAP